MFFLAMAEKYIVSININVTKVANVSQHLNLCVQMCLVSKLVLEVLSYFW